MLSALRRRLELKKQRSRAVSDSEHWKNHPRLQKCLQALRGDCALVSMELHEAAITVVNIALTEDTWSVIDRIPADFLTPTVYIVWDAPLLPVLRADQNRLTACLDDVTAVAGNTYFVSKSLDRVVHFHSGMIRLYSVSP